MSTNGGAWGSEGNCHCILRMRSRSPENKDLSEHRSEAEILLIISMEKAGMAEGAQDMLRTSLGQLLGRVMSGSTQVLSPTPTAPLNSWKLGLVFPSLHSPGLPLQAPKGLVRSGRSTALASALRDTI